VADPYIDIPALQQSLTGFFAEERADLGRFGSTVNQTFEAYVFAETLSWYRNQKWRVKLVHPLDEQKKRRKHCHLKFSTSGRPGNYTYASCTRHKQVIQIRHQLRVATKHYLPTNRYPANVCLDVAVIVDCDLESFTTKTPLPNDKLVTFGEAKHMSAFAELIAGFVGMVHEIQPGRLVAHSRASPLHLSPFLYVSGWLNGTALGLKETIDQRAFDVNIFSVDNKLSDVAIKVSPKTRKKVAKKT
jgi:hypothetical protein